MMNFDMYQQDAETWVGLLERGLPEGWTARVHNEPGEELAVCVDHELAPSPMLLTRRRECRAVVWWLKLQEIVGEEMQLAAESESAEPAVG